MNASTLRQSSLVVILPVLLLVTGGSVAAGPGQPDESDQPKMSGQQREAKIAELTRQLIEAAGEGHRKRALKIALEALDHAKAYHAEAGDEAASSLSMTNYNVACMHALLDGKDEAFKNLSAAIDAGGFGGNLADQIEGDDDFDTLRDDPRYGKMIEKARSMASKGGDRGDARGRMRRRMMRDDGAPKVGETAPTFNLESFDGKSEADLADFRAKSPVLLFFGSYT